jgi:predicted NodU family carbamoyl transferase
VRTGVPVLLDASFNEREPICCMPEVEQNATRTKMGLFDLDDLLIKKR